MWNCGLDCHEESIRICLLDPTGKRELEATVDTETTDLESLLGPYVKQGLRVALEASGVSFPVHDRMKALGCEVNVWPPKKLRVIAESKAKCDKNDARWLAELLRTADAEPDLDTLREGVRVMTQALMELEVAQHLGAERVRHVGTRTIPFAERRGSE